MRVDSSWRGAAGPAWFGVLVFAAGVAEAVLQVDIYESGADVVVEMAGSVDLGGMSNLGNVPAEGFVDPSGGRFALATTACRTSPSTPPR